MTTPNLNKVNKTSFTEKEKFHSSLNLENITDEYYMHAKIACKDFEVKNLGEHHYFYVKNDKLLLANVYENFMYLKIYHLHPAKFLLTPRLAWQAVFNS